MGREEEKGDLFRIRCTTMTLMESLVTFYVLNCHGWGEKLLKVILYQGKREIGSCKKVRLERKEVCSAGCNEWKSLNSEIEPKVRASKLKKRYLRRNCFFKLGKSGETTFRRRG